MTYDVDRIRARIPALAGGTAYSPLLYSDVALTLPVTLPILIAPGATATDTWRASMKCSKLAPTSTKSVVRPIS